MSETSGTGYQIYIVLALFVLITCAHVVCAEDINRTIVVPVNGSEITNSSSFMVNLSTTIPVTEGIRTTQYQVQDPITIQPRQIQPALQRKISTNLLYLIDANVTQTGFSREQAAERLKENGQLKVERRVASVVNRVTADPAIQPLTNQVYVFIELHSLASTHVVDAYVPNVTERNDDEHYVMGWVYIDDLETIAALDPVTNVRTAQPSITAASPVYTDKIFLNPRAGNQSPISVDEAKASVREFEKVPGVVTDNKRTITFPQGDFYELTSDSGIYLVNIKTGEIQLITFISSNSPNSRSMRSTSVKSVIGQLAGPVTMEQGESITRDYAVRNYKNFYNRTLVLAKSQLLDHGDAGKEYYYFWTEKINSVDNPNGVIVFLNYESGEINSYISFDQMVNVDIVPTVTRSDALTKAAAIFSPIFIVRTDAHLRVQPVNENNQRLVWDMEITGIPRDAIEQGGSVLIDAHSGEIIEVGRYA